jgi:hypothetical protein
MQKILLLLVVSVIGHTAFSQKVDSIYFHLYTDSLKKGTHNYINVDAKLSNGRWQPLTEKDLTFSSDYGHFSGNDLVLPENPAVKKVTVKAILKSNNNLWLERVIWIKTIPNPDVLPTTDEVLKPKRKKS